MAEDYLALKDVTYATMEGEEIESYPEDLPLPSLLVYGRSKANDPIHSAWAYDMLKNIAILITAYRPDPQKWKDFRERRQG